MPPWEPLMFAALAIVTSNIQTWFVKQAMTGLVGKLGAPPLPVRDGLVDLATQGQMRGRHGVEQGDPPAQVRHGAAAER